MEIKKKKETKKIFKGVSLDPKIASFIDEESKRQHRSFSSQSALMLEEWIKDHNPAFLFLQNKL